MIRSRDISFNIGPLFAGIVFSTHQVAFGIIAAYRHESHCFSLHVHIGCFKIAAAISFKLSKELKGI